MIAEVLGYPGVPKSLQHADLGGPLLPIVPVNFKKGNQRFNYFSTVTTLGTPQDITVQELRIECFFPADEATERAAEELVHTPRT